MIKFQQVSKIFQAPDGRSVPAVKEVSFEVQEGATLCLIGTSGSGKTTTMKMINRLIAPTSGTVSVAGHDVQQQDPIRLRRSIGYVIQKGGLFPHLTVRANVGLLCRLEEWDAKRTADRVDQLLELVNLPAKEYADRYPSELSGGQRQRVGVARALALDPDTILMDEPFGALDPITRDQIHEEFLSLKKAVKKTIVLVTHDMAEAFKLGDRIGLMHFGELLQCGTEGDFRRQPVNEFVAEFLKTHLARPVSAREMLDGDVPVVASAEGSHSQLVLQDGICRLHHDGQTIEIPKVDANLDTSSALARMLDSPTSALAVVDGDRLLGAITKESLLRAF